MNTSFSNAFGGPSGGAPTSTAPLIVAFKNITVLTTGAPADVASITLPSWVTRYVVILTGSRCICESASGTLAGASFIIQDVANSSSSSDNMSSSFAGPASTSVTVSVTGTAISRAPSVATTLYLRQSANSANAGTISVYLVLVPLL